MIENADFSEWKYEIPPSGIALLHPMVSAH